MENKQVQMELASYIGRTLRENFGKGPESVFVSYNQSIMSVYLRNFITPSEVVLLGQNQESIVHKTRDMLMQNLIPEFKAYIKILTGMEIKEFYYDWSLQNKSGVFVGISSSSSETNEMKSDDFEGRENLHKEIKRISIQAQKDPEEVLSFRLNQRTLVVIRKGILVSIERELIRLGGSETLKLAKRNLEKRLLHNSNNFEAILNTKVIDIFVDWDFSLDKSAIVLVLTPT
ncbi:Na-translocating system protein MpsC family protein [Paenibacillus sp. BSR1-1]|uniref:Na-translocating system protein MpsC family protein n=1 Tax=Paenibacillus sp. BSR1-1 TaxID=3020845 RepID=UPI0025B0738B|nr:Na-translocating system protein MpsC family protein [Paenibacillus sp. BSR1-1]MDN3016425.1 Na-translocating system protein MpsC family protein [Paenibacillus sp. BSR1-1]